MDWIPFSPNWNDSDKPTLKASPNQTTALLEPNPVTVGDRKIVIADDDPVSREILTSMLGKWRYHVIVANDGREAMGVLRAQREPVLAILDWMMPGLEGPEICRRVRESDKMIYILLLTARGGKERIVEGLEAGADDYLTKPFDKDELRARLAVGARILNLQIAHAARVRELEAALAENRDLRLQMPL